MNCSVTRNVTGPGVFDGPWDGNGFITLYVGPNCTCPSDSDVAGPGAIWSTITAALLSDMALLTVILIDNKIGSPTTLRLPRFLCKTITGEHRKEMFIIVRATLIDYILAAADNMAILGTSLLISTYLDTFLDISYPSTGSLSALSYQNNYFTAVVYCCCLASCTHIGSLLAIRHHLQGRRTSTKIRIVLFSLFATALCITIDLSEDAFQAFFVYIQRLLIFDMHWGAPTEKWLVEYFAPIVTMGYLYWISIHPLLEPNSDINESDKAGLRRIVWQYMNTPFCYLIKVGKKTWYLLDPRSQNSQKWNFGWLKIPLKFIIFSHPAVALMIHLIFTGVSISFLLLLRYTNARPPTALERHDGVGEWCSMRNNANNRWSYGQWMPLFLLVTPVFTSCMRFHDLKVKSMHQVTDLESQVPETLGLNSLANDKPFDKPGI